MLCTRPSNDVPPCFQVPDRDVVDELAAFTCTHGTVAGTYRFGTACWNVSFGNLILDWGEQQYGYT